MKTWCSAHRKIGSLIIKSTDSQKYHFYSAVNVSYLKHFLWYLSWNPFYKSIYKPADSLENLGTSEIRDLQHEIISKKINIVHI